jgi:hypothetical protein
MRFSLLESRIKIKSALPGTDREMNTIVGPLGEMVSAPKPFNQKTLKNGA